MYKIAQTLTSQSHPTPRHHGRAMGHLLWEICTQMAALYRGYTIYRLQGQGWNDLIKNIWFFFSFGLLQNIFMCIQYYLHVFHYTCTFWCEAYQHKELSYKRHLFQTLYGGTSKLGLHHPSLSFIYCVSLLLCKFLATNNYELNRKNYIASHPSCNW